MKFSVLMHKIFVIVTIGLALEACGATGLSSRAAGSEEQFLVDLRVMELDDKTAIVIQGERPVKYTIFSLQNPPRFVINLLSMKRGSIKSSLGVNRGIIQKITLEDGRNPHPSVRMEVFLDQFIKPEIRAVNNALYIDFPKPQMKDPARVVDKYRIGPEDVLEIMVWKNAELTRTVTVRPDGMVSLPLIGDVQASGRSTEELKDIVTERMQEFIATPSVSILVSSIKSYFYHILGEIAKPGKYPLKERTTILQAISVAGGFKPFASKNKISVFRRDPSSLTETKIQVRFDDIISSADPRKNLVIQSGDTIVIP